MPLSSLLRNLKLTAASNAGVFDERLTILDEYLVDHCWMLTPDHHLDNRLSLSHVSRRRRPLIGDSPGGSATVPCHTFLESSSSWKLYLTCNAGTYRFSRYSFIDDQNIWILGIPEVSPSKKGEHTSRIHVPSCKISRQSVSLSPRYL